MPTNVLMYGNNGYVSDRLCNEEGNFQTPCLYEITFDEERYNPIPGFTVRWSTTYNEWATAFKIQAFQGSTELFSAEIEDNEEVISEMPGDIRDYDKVILTIYSWNRPLHRARVEEIFFGVQRKYTKDDIISFSADMQADPMAATLPKSEINFTIQNLNAEFNPDSPNSLTMYLMERQLVTARCGYKLINEKTGKDGIEWIPLGIYFLNEWETPQNGITTSFGARDSLEFMSDNYTGRNNGTFMDIAIDALTQAELPLADSGQQRWVLDTVLNTLWPPKYTEGDTSATRNLQNKSIAVVLQYIANAAKCVFYQDRNGLIHIERLVEELYEYETNQFNSYSNSEIKLSKRLKEVNVNEGQFILPVGREGETQKLSNPLITDAMAPKIAKWAQDVLESRRTYTGDFRADPRLDPLDFITNQNQFARAIVLVTQVGYTYNGAFRGSYTAKKITTPLGSFYYSGDLFSGEV